MKRTNSSVNNNQTTNHKTCIKVPVILLGAFSGALYLHASDPAIERYFPDQTQVTNRVMAEWIRIGATITNGLFNTEAYFKLLDKNSGNSNRNCQWVIKKILSIIISIAAVLPSWHIAFTHLKSNQTCQKILVITEACLNIPINLAGIDQIFNGLNDNFNHLKPKEYNFKYLMPYLILFIPVSLTAAWQNVGFTIESYNASLTFLNLIKQANDTIWAKIFAIFMAGFNLLPCIYFTIDSCKISHESIIYFTIDSCKSRSNGYHNSPSNSNWCIKPLILIAVMMAMVSGFTSDQANYNAFANPTWAYISGIIGNIGVVMGYNLPQVIQLINRFFSSEKPEVDTLHESTHSKSLLSS